MTKDQLHTKLAEIKDLCLKNCNLSAHILDLKIQEMQLIHEEIEGRRHGIASKAKQS